MSLPSDKAVEAAGEVYAEGRGIAEALEAAEPIIREEERERAEAEFLKVEDRAEIHEDLYRDEHFRACKLEDERDAAREKHERALREFKEKLEGLQRFVPGMADEGHPDGSEYPTIKPHDEGDLLRRPGPA